MNRGAPLRGNVERPVPSPSPHNATHRTRRENAHRDAHSTASPGNANALRKTWEQTRTNGRLFLSPPPLHARRSSETRTFTLSALRARTYARLSRFSFFAFTPSPTLRKSLAISALWVKALLFFSFTAFFSERQNRKHRKTIVILAKQKYVNRHFSSVPPAVKEKAKSLHPKRSIAQIVTDTR